MGRQAGESTRPMHRQGQDNRPTSAVGAPVRMLDRVHDPIGGSRRRTREATSSRARNSPPDRPEQEFKDESRPIVHGSRSSRPRIARAPARVARCTGRHRPRCGGRGSGRREPLPPPAARTPAHEQPQGHAPFHQGPARAWAVRRLPTPSRAITGRHGDESSTPTPPGPPRPKPRPPWHASSAIRATTAASVACSRVRDALEIEG